MPPKRNFDAELATLEALRDARPEAAEPELANRLADLIGILSDPITSHQCLK
jgi:hypothetical protein